MSPGRIPRMTPWTATARMEKIRRLVPSDDEVDQQDKYKKLIGQSNHRVTS